MYMLSICYVRFCKGYAHIMHRLCIGYVYGYLRVMDMLCIGYV